MIDILRNRRSIRKFQNRPVEEDKVELLIEAALRSPSSRGRNPWSFVVVTEPELLQSLGQAKEHGSGFLAGAPLAVVVAADTNKTDAWVEDCSIAGIILQLQAEAIGLGSCWAQIRLRPHDTQLTAEAYIKQLLDLPDSFAVECVIGIGYPDEAKPGHPAETLLRDQVHRDRYTGK